MTEKELKKLNRYQLLELLVMQTERADELQQKVNELEERLQERDLSFSKLGSIAEAAIHITGVLEASQEAADLYLVQARKRADEMVENARHQAAFIRIQAEANALGITNLELENVEEQQESGI